MWSWSHTIEGMQNVRDNIAKQNREWLEVVYSEWVAAGDKTDEDWSENFDEEVFNTAMDDVKNMDSESLADFIADRAEDMALCDNGGFNAYCCPYACDCHSVSFSKE